MYYVAIHPDIQLIANYKCNDCAGMLDISIQFSIYYIQAQLERS